jgi:hypothetical protein
MTRNGTAPREIAKKMRRRLTAQTEFGPHSKGEAAHFANAAARVLRALTTHQLKRCGEDLIELIEQEVPVDALRKVANRERPSSMEMRTVARQLALKRPETSDLDRNIWLGW